MAKYLQFSKQTYENKRIVLFVGFDPPIDPEMTKQKIKPIIEGSEEYAKQQELIAKKVEMYKQQLQLNSEYNSRLDPQTGRWIGPPVEKKRIQADYVKLGEDLNILEIELSEHAQKCEEIWRGIRVANAVYLAPGNAILIDDEEVQRWVDLLKQKQPGQFLLEDGEIVTETEVEQTRIANLAPENRQAEKEVRIREVLIASMRMRNELEIKGDENALEKAQEWYEVEKAKLEEQYT